MDEAPPDGTVNRLRWLEAQAEQAAMPEPTTFVLLGLGAVFYLRRHVRRLAQIRLIAP